MKKGSCFNFFVATLVGLSDPLKWPRGSWVEGHYGKFMGRFIIPYGHHSGEHHGNYGNHRGYGGYGNHGSQIQTDKNGTVCRS